MGLELRKVVPLGKEFTEKRHKGNFWDASDIILLDLKILKIVNI